MEKQLWKTIICGNIEKKKTSTFPETSSPLEISSDATKAGFMHDFSLQLILKSYNNFFKKGC